MRIDLFRNLEANISERLSTPAYCRIVNARNAIRGKKHRLRPLPTEDPHLHVVTDGADQITICRRGRHNRAKRGIMAGVNKLAEEYSLDVVKDLRDGVFIDCGANVGELGYWARARGYQYIAFEPEPLEARCVDLNHFEGQDVCQRKALWKEDTELKFYNRADEADSSVLEDGSDAVPHTVIEAVRLDAAVDLSSATGPVILKLEAEGAEPEVLEGAAGCIDQIDWIAVDCGYERGADRQHTFVETNTFMWEHGFVLVAAKFQRVTALYRRMT